MTKMIIKLTVKMTMILNKMKMIQKRQSWGMGGRGPQIFGRGSRRGGRRGDRGGCEILLYLIVYRKYVRKW